MEMDFPTEQHAIDFASRSVSLKGMFDVWGEGTSMESMLSSAQQCPIEKMVQSRDSKNQTKNPLNIKRYPMNTFLLSSFSSSQYYIKY